MSWTHVRSQIARAVKDGAPPEVVRDLRRDLRAARAEEYLRNLVVSEPPLRADQLGDLAAILSGAPAAA
jgi:hypothetical protein